MIATRLWTRWSGNVMKRPGHKNFNAVSHNRSWPEVLFLNLTWRSREQISSVLLQLLLFAFSNRKFGRHGKWSVTFWQWENNTYSRTARGCGIQHLHFLAGPFHYVTRSPGMPFSTYSCFEKGCLTNGEKLTRCRNLLWVMVVFTVAWVNLKVFKRGGRKQHKHVFVFSRPLLLNRLEPQ